jgi:hypothetical protein
VFASSGHDGSVSKPVPLDPDLDVVPPPVSSLVPSSVDPSACPLSPVVDVELDPELELELELELDLDAESTVVTAAVSLTTEPLVPS